MPPATLEGIEKYLGSGLIKGIGLHSARKLVKAFDERVVDYDFNELDEIALAYAISIHKAQGSEYPAVVIPLAMLHYMLLERNLLYTAVTRGKQLVVIIAQPRALAMAVKNQRAQRRITHLISRLRQGDRNAN